MANNTRLWIFSPQTLTASDPAAMIGAADQDSYDFYYRGGDLLGLPQREQRDISDAILLYGGDQKIETRNISRARESGQPFRGCQSRTGMAWRSERKR